MINIILETKQAVLLSEILTLIGLCQLEKYYEIYIMNRYKLKEDLHCCLHIHQMYNLDYMTIKMM